MFQLPSGSRSVSKTKKKSRAMCVVSTGFIHKVSIGCAKEIPSRIFLLKAAEGVL